MGALHNRGKLKNMFNFHRRVRSVNFTEKPSFFRKLNLTPRFNFRKVAFSTKIVPGSNYRTVSKILGGTDFGQRTNLKNGGTNSRTIDKPSNYRVNADPKK